MSLSCLLIGQDNLLIQCGKFLLEKNHHIKWVVTPLQSIQTWCEKNNIAWVSSLNELPEDKIHSVDYLFSIVNGIILKEDDLNIARFGAINYHDSILPKYAGVNATTWAIMNGEKTHGITWHMVNNGIDEGDIVYQGSFPLSENETALTLNLKCFDEATKGFTEIINRIETNSLIKQPQSITGRSYYGLTHALPDFGFINWETATAISIHALSRALNFGNYSNNVGTLKLYLGQNYLVVTETEVSNKPIECKQSGTLLSIEPHGLLISTQNQSILLKKFITIEGKSLTNQEVIQQYHLTVGKQLPLIDSAWLNNNSSYYRKILKNEKFWLQNLSDILEHTTFSDRLLNQGNDPTKLAKVMLPHSQLNNSTAYLLAIVLIYLYRLNNYENCSVLLSHAKIPVLPPEYSQLFATFLPFTLNLESEWTSQQVVDAISQKLDLFDTRGTFLNDISIRQPVLKSLEKECLISVNLSNENHSEIPKNSMLHFHIDSHSSSLSIYHRLNTQYQGGTITPLIENMTTHLSNIMHAIVAKPKQRIHQITFLAEDEHKKLLSWSIGEYLPLPSNSLNELFERHVKTIPNHPAVYQGDQLITYHQLWQAAEQIAMFLQSLNLKFDSRVGILMQPTAHWLACILGIFKAGLCAFPIQEHQSNVLNSSKIECLITTSLDEFKNNSDVKAYTVDTILDSQVTEPFNIEPSKQAQLIIGDENAVKTVTQTQIINYCYWFTRTTGFRAESILTLSSHVPFNFVISCVLAPLLVGGALILQQEDSEINPLHALRHLSQVSHLRITPEEWKKWLLYPEEILKLNNLQYVLLTQEAPEMSTIDKWLRLCPQSQFMVLPNAPF